MRLIIKIIGLVLVIVGIFGLSHQYFSYTTNEKVAQIGDIQVTAEKEKVIFLTPAASAIFLVGGIILVMVGFSRRKM